METTEKKEEIDSSMPPLARVLCLMALQKMVINLGKFINIIAGKPMGSVLVVFDPDNLKDHATALCVEEKNVRKIAPALRAAADQIEKQLSSARDGDKVH